VSEVYTVPPKPGVKLSKKNAGYVAKGPFGCLHCSWFEEPRSGGVGRCDPVGGPVNRHGCCDFWNDQDAPKNAGKQGCEYVYVPGSGYTCTECKFFDPASRSCSPVEGDIAPEASCNKWMPIEDDDSGDEALALLEIGRLIRIR